MTDTAKAFFAGFFVVIGLFIIFTSSWTSGIIESLGGALSSVGTGLETGKKS